MIGHWWHSYWAWTGGNIGAMPLEAVITVAATVLLIRPARWAWRKAFGEHPATEVARRAAEAAERSLRIAADLYEHHTGARHPDAPDVKTESEAK